MGSHLWIVADDGYREEYHKVFDALISGYFESGDFNRDFDRVNELLLPYVEKGPTAFYSAEQYQVGCETLKNLCNRRAESIRLQLDGKLPTVSENQPDQDKVQASDINIIDTGAAVFG